MLNEFFGWDSVFYTIQEYCLLFKLLISAFSLNTQDQHSAMVEYHVPIAPGGVADIFDQLESSKNALQIKHFSVSQTTLDEVRRSDIN